LIKAISGLHRIDSGEIYVRGQAVSIRSAAGRHAARQSRPSTRTLRLPRIEHRRNLSSAASRSISASSASSRRSTAASLKRGERALLQRVRHFPKGSMPMRRYAPSPAGERQAIAISARHASLSPR